MGAAVQAAAEGPGAVAAAVGEHQAQRQEEQRAQEQLLVGQGHHVPALLVEVGEGGDAQEGPHGAQAPRRAPAGSGQLPPGRGAAKDGERLCTPRLPTKIVALPKRGARRRTGVGGRNPSAW